jgi:DNA/RNA endonuclease YhcR with UshA esterase domain
MIFSVGQITPQKIQIKDMNMGMVDKEVKVEGLIQSVTKSKNGETYFLEIMDGTGKTKVILFPSASSDLDRGSVKVTNLNQRRVSIVGKVSEYHGSLEIILKDSKSLKIL